MRNKIFIALAFIFTLAISAAAFAAYERTADNTVPAYTDPELRNRNGNERVDAGDRLIVFEERENSYYVRYPVRNGTKDRWVPKNVFNGSGNNNPQGGVHVAESPAPYTLHVKGEAFDPDNSSGSIRVHIYVGGTPGSSVPQYEIRTDGNSRIFDDTRTIDRNYAGRQLVHVYALNEYGSGNNVEIWNGYVDIKSEGVNNKLQELINQWNGRKWTDGYSRSGNAEKRLNSSAIQCKEFASYIFNILYDTGYIGSGSTSSNYYNWRLSNTPTRVYQVAEVPQTNNAYQAREAFRNLFAQAQPGDFIQIKRGSGGAHSAIFVGRTGDGIQWLDANADGANSVRLQTYSYDDLVKTTSRGYQWNVAMSLYRAR